jgi:hypothetical protein
MQPTLAMLTVAEKLAGFIAGDARLPPSDLFAKDIVIVENFAPYIFRDVSQWAEKMRAHLAGITDLRCHFGVPIDFSWEGDRAYFALPTTWSGNNHGVPFAEIGGWGLVLRVEGGEWRLAGYGWAVIETTVPQ